MVLGCSSIILAFTLGITTSRVYDHYLLARRCELWRENVNRWVRVIGDLPADLTDAETAALTLAHGTFIAIRDHVCGHATLLDRTPLTP